VIAVIRRILSVALRCTKVFGPSVGASAKKKPWTYFLSHHYQHGHEYRYSWRKCKADNDLQSQSHLAVSVRESTNDNNIMQWKRRSNPTIKTRILKCR
jgi:hypothetical protein